MPSQDLELKNIDLPRKSDLYFFQNGNIYQIGAGEKGNELLLRYGTLNFTICC